ncbi:MAG TPA: ferredoxin [Mycobacteriales bacterium]
MRVVVDMVKCVGHGVCESLADDVFEVGDDGYTHLLVDPIPADREEIAREAVRRCPAQALSVAD